MEKHLSSSYVLPEDLNPSVLAPLLASFTIERRTNETNRSVLQAALSLKWNLYKRCTLQIKDTTYYKGQVLWSQQNHDNYRTSSIYAKIILKLAGP